MYIYIYIQHINQTTHLHSAQCRCREDLLLHCHLSSSDNKLSMPFRISECAGRRRSIRTRFCTYLMRSCAELSAPCSCLTVVAAEATLTEEAPGAATGGDGAAVTAVLAPGSVFTVGSDSREESVRERFIPIIPHSWFQAELCLLVYN